MKTSPCICFFSALYLPSLGGVETYTANLARELALKDMRVIVVTLDSHESKRVVSEQGIEVVRLPCCGLLGNRYPIAIKTKEYQSLWSWLENQHIDYVVVNTRFYPHSREGLSFARAKEITPILIEHGSAHLTLGNPLVDAGVQLVEHTITATERQFHASHWAVSSKASQWLSHFGIESCGELSNSINADAYVNSASSRNFRAEFNLPANTFIVAFAGRLVSEKGILELAQAVQEWNEYTPFVVLAAGDGPLREKLQAYENEYFQLLGRLESGDVAALLAQANVMCLPSRSEGFATSLLEAAACNTPVITTDIGGTDELIPNATYGTIIPNRNPATIRHALEEAVRNPQRIKNQGIQAGKLARSTYSWEKTAQRVLEACQKAQS